MLPVFHLAGLVVLSWFATDPNLVALLKDHGPNVTFCMSLTFGYALFITALYRRCAFFDPYFEFFVLLSVVIFDIVLAMKMEYMVQTKWATTGGYMAPVNLYRQAVSAVYLSHGILLYVYLHEFDDTLNAHR
ncbi:Hypothetical protein POVN_LOCUS737 [uncultured virus]|nr:Hypothetical protein POVN_LOCUS737 [uncultured virus]